MISDPSSILLGVNIDHVATLRQARGTRYPDPLEAAFIAEQAGADGVTVHLREDRRHIQERDVRMLRETVQTKLNLELALTEATIAFAENVKPHDCCIVPERREELTTEGGLDVRSQFERARDCCARLAGAGIRVSLFIDPEPAQIAAAAAAGAAAVELHTGAYAACDEDATRAREFSKLLEAAHLASKAGLRVNAGHGLHYHNVAPVAAIREIAELNIGHAIVARALMTGIGAAVREMKRAMTEARR